MELLKRYIYICKAGQPRDIANDIRSCIAVKTLSAKNKPIPTALWPSGYTVNLPEWLDIDNPDMVEMILHHYKYLCGSRSYVALIEIAGVDPAKILAAR